MLKLCNPHGRLKKKKKKNKNAAGSSRIIILTFEYSFAS